jgi:hypothetical protein
MLFCSNASIQKNVREKRVHFKTMRFVLGAGEQTQPEKSMQSAISTSAFLLFPQMSVMRLLNNGKG